MNVMQPITKDFLDNDNPSGNASTRSLRTEI